MIISSITIITNQQLTKMKTFKCMLACAALAMLASCNEEPGNSSSTGDGGQKLPEDAIVWSADTTVTLTDHFIVPEGKSLYIYEGARIVASNTAVKPEIVVLGNMYVLGTEEKPVTFTVEASSQSDRFSRNWGGIICGYDCQEVVMLHAIVEYGGALTTENSASFQHQLFKTETGEGVPAFHFCNPNGKFVIMNCTFRNNAEDQIYITGGRSIVANNRFICNGYDGGEAINYKSECLADICYNLIYDANTNGFKLSNSGFTNIQSDLYVYNNTIVNSGWRRPGVKGGSIWLEESIAVKLYNNLVYDCRWGLKSDTEEPYDAINSVITPNYYFASTQVGVNQMMPDDLEGILRGDNDINSTFAGEKDPMFVRFEQQSNIDINCGGNNENAPVAYNNDWDFSLAAGSPALSGGKTDFNRHYASALTFDGLANGVYETSSFVSPAPSVWFGAYGMK